MQILWNIVNLIARHLSSSPRCGQKQTVAGSGSSSHASLPKEHIYSSNDTCRYLSHVYRQSKSSNNSRVLFKVELLKGGKPVKQGKWMRLSMGGKEIGDDGWLNITGEEALAGLDAGLYELNLSVKDEQSNKTTRRSTFFCIE